MIAVIGFVAVRIRFFVHVNRRNIRKFQELIEEQYWAESYGGLLSLLQRHFQRFIAIYRGSSVLARMRDRLDCDKAPSLKDTIRALNKLVPK